MRFFSLFYLLMYLWIYFCVVLLSAILKWELNGIIAKPQSIYLTFGMVKERTKDGNQFLQERTDIHQ